MSNKIWDRISYAQSAWQYEEKPVNLTNWVPSEHTPQTKAAEDFNNHNCHIGRQNQLSFWFPDFEEDDA